MHDFSKSFGLTIILAIFLLSAALYNGFPLVFSDSGTYLMYSVKWGVPVDRPAFYSWLIAVFNPNAKLPIFTIVVAQALLTSIVLLITLQCLQITNLKSKMLLFMLLAFTTSLPWFVGQLMPDFLLGIGLLSAYTLIYYYDCLNNLKRIFLSTVFIYTSLVHYSNAPIMVSFLLLFLITIIIFRKNNETIYKSVISRSVILSFLAIATLTANHLYTKTQLQQMPTAHFLVNRLTDSGIIQKLLNEHCDGNDYILCPHKDKVKPSYLWSHSSSPFNLIGGFQSPAEESWRMIYDSIKFYPLDHIVSSTRNTSAQLLKFNTGDGLIPYGQDKSINRAIGRLYSSEYINFASSKQQQDELKILLSFVRPLHNVVVGISFLVLLFSLVYLKRHDNATFILTIFILSALLGNAAICGIFSGAYDRYQSRIIWLVPFVAAIVLMRLKEERYQQESRETIESAY